MHVYNDFVAQNKPLFNHYFHIKSRCALKSPFKSQVQLDLWIKGLWIHKFDRTVEFQSPSIHKSVSDLWIAARGIRKSVSDFWFQSPPIRKSVSYFWLQSLSIHGSDRTADFKVRQFTSSIGLLISKSVNSLVRFGFLILKSVNAQVRFGLLI